MKVLEIPKLRQTYDFDCGPSALQAVLAFYGIKIREDCLIKSARTTEKGTLVPGLLRTIKKYGLKAKSKTMDIEEVKSYIDKNIPVIVVMQAWTEHKNMDWWADWKDGHYTVVIGYDSKKIIFEDPASFEKTYLTYEEFDKRWHDADPKGKTYIRHGIAVFGKKPEFDGEKIVHMG
jgi:predicted double-glycine peptidase